MRAFSAFQAAAVPRGAPTESAQTIEAVASVTDGGRIKASGNGNPAQCTNIAWK
jgi:hypothetical protein